MKTIKQLVKELCRREGKKIGVSVAQMNEIVGCLSDLMYEDFGGEIEWLLIENGQNRAEKPKKKKVKK